MATIVLDRGHHGKAHDELGAACLWGGGDIDAALRAVGELEPGKSWRTTPGTWEWVYSSALVEERLTREYMRHAEDRLRALGHRVVIVSAGEGHGYRARWKTADALKADVYVQCHCNAGAGDYGLVVHDKRSTKGKALAARVRDALGDACPELRRTLAHSGERFPRAQNVIAGVRAVAVVYEPGFIDYPAHNSLWRPDGLERVGIALADGIDEWLTTR